MPKRGYSDTVKNRANSPDAKGLGVELGRLCIKHGYSADELAGAFGVSRMTAYNWITGRHVPSKHLQDKVQKLIDRLKLKLAPRTEDE
jgi:transcriptional regulator with XRE-family HTH domain